MKINVTFDLTPEEFRRVMGLPDVQEFQKELFASMLEKMKSGEDGYDAMSLYQPMFNEGMNAMGQFQKMMLSMMSGASSSDKENS
ncbi:MULTISPECIES: DUF6489 family protein [Oceanospirillaceae]|jgi:hypothetical protein|uniref:DUF6489 family protein n=1 Tax=Oceanospirillaceae TaxID=135620 RepID=UPI00011EFD1A|nr:MULTISPECIES: DUF6489 family protein [Thalassolituus]MBU2039404.1 hypothetical protein [Gammaproteobacteria bacterium]PIQ40452.1 MAG: hypothetical protein COW58_05795 [Thalassolituus sp. CG17_big_fil_post_rev_8_21_14_2_50_53_8]MCA6058382.1 hypothetical protein [Thalassolituus sp. ST750PaO-4]MCB2385754.1 DUF6489 family protein [Thalassolituus alkanivorans]MCB2424058.1 DUF6489 family protein [Thalassolituus alkanivorans]